MEVFNTTTHAPKADTPEALNFTTGKAVERVTIDGVEVAINCRAIDIFSKTSAIGEELAALEQADAATLSQAFDELHQKALDAIAFAVVDSAAYVERLKTTDLLTLIEILGFCCQVVEKNSTQALESVQKMYTALDAMTI